MPTESHFCGPWGRGSKIVGGWVGVKRESGAKETHYYYRKNGSDLDPRTQINGLKLR